MEQTKHLGGHIRSIAAHYRSKNDPDFPSPELGPLVSSSSECEGSDLQLLDVHGQYVRWWQGGPHPRVFSPHQAQVVTL